MPKTPSPVRVAGIRRFYSAAEAVAADAGFGVVLDGRRLLSPNGCDFVVPTEALARAIAGEWNAQGEQVRPPTMPLTGLASTALDRVARERTEIVARVAGYAATDLVCYRALRPPALAARQREVWQPLVDWAQSRYGAPLVVTEGVLPASQAPASLDAFAAAVAAHDDFALAALSAATAACGSLVIALALIEGRLDAAAAFTASQLDETFQIEAWGEDPEQAARRRALAAEIEAAATFLALLRPQANTERKSRS
jgi:chaperone required for assembly of F1-ATPase